MMNLSLTLWVDGITRANSCAAAYSIFQHVTHCKEGDYMEIGETHPAHIRSSDNNHILQRMTNVRHCLAQILYYRLLCLWDRDNKCRNNQNG